uniref:Uncharacterized protein n=1 Tax=Timema monikensis TaxID=170555 RepID=A0A7R9HJU0_9NEOP|nr:unnamed protein product [Timema monikensis]
MRGTRDDPFVISSIQGWAVSPCHLLRSWRWPRNGLDSVGQCSLDIDEWWGLGSWASMHGVMGLSISVSAGASEHANMQLRLRTPLSIGSLGGHYRSHPVPMGSSFFSHWTDSSGGYLTRWFPVVERLPKLGVPLV